MKTFTESMLEDPALLAAHLADCERVITRAYPEVTAPGAQAGEDDILAKLLPQAHGFYVDVGAGEPVQSSNTWQFYKRGWRGVLVEPLPQFWYPLMRQRPGDIVVPIAALDKAGMARLRVQGTVSSMRPDWPIESQSQLLVEAESLENILLPYNIIREECSLLSIDAEGVEPLVIAGINWATFKPRVIVIEYRKYEPDRLGEDLSATWEPMILGQGYILSATTDLNKIYVRGDYDACPF